MASSPDLSYPNDEAIDHIGALDKFDQQHHDGWAESVIDRIQAEIQRSNNNNPNIPTSFDRGNYTAEELALYDYYTNEVIPIDKWKALVKAYQDGTLEDDNVTWDPFNEDHDYVGGDHGSTFAPPDGVTEYSGGGEGGGDLVVVTKALDHFRQQLALFAPQGTTGPIWKAINNLDAIQIKAGTFGKAVRLKEIVEGRTSGGQSSGGLKGDTRGFLAIVHEALYDVQTNLNDLVREYDTAEEFNSLTGEQLDNVFREAWGDVGKFDQFGSQGTETEGGSGGDDDD